MLNKEFRWRHPIAIFVGIPIFLILDSDYVGEYIAYSQSIATLLVVLVFFNSYRKTSKRVKHIMLLGVAVGFIGEIFFSLILGMYHYRYENIPLWVGFGHSLIFVSVYKVARYKYVLKNIVPIKMALLSFAIGYTILWLYLANDWFGFWSSIAFMFILLIAKKSQLFFLIMFLIVCYIEQVGTSTGTWFWPNTLLGMYDWMPSGNPPSGIAVFYFLFDAIILVLYLTIHKKVKYRWNRLKNI